MVETGDFILEKRINFRSSLGGSIVGSKLFQITIPLLSYYSFERTRTYPFLINCIHEMFVNIDFWKIFIILPSI